jgi:hypothetical protein
MQSGSVAFAPVPEAVPAQLPVNGVTGPVGAMVPEGGFAAVAFRVESVANTPAAIRTLKIKLNHNQPLFNRAFLERTTRINFFMTLSLP